MFGTSPELAVRLVNSEDRAAGTDALENLAGLREFLRPTPNWASRATRADLEAMRRARPRIRDVFAHAAANNEAAAVRLLNALLRNASVRPRLAGPAGAPRLRLIEDVPSVAAAYLSSAVVGLAGVVGERGIGRLGICAAAGCSNAYLDESSRRRFCSTRCAGRVHVAAHRARQQSDRA